MTELAGVSFSATKPGYLDRAAIPEDDFVQHYLLDASTKDKSSFPVVDAKGYLRRGNVVQAWGQRDRTEQDIESDLLRLARQFEDDPLADEREGTAVDELFDSDVSELQVNEDLAFAATTGEGLDFNQFSDRIGTGFNEYGVRENYGDDGSLASVDVVFKAMEPGPPERRNGVRITEEFLKSVSSKEYAGSQPHLKDHETKNTFARIGSINDLWYSDGNEALMLMVNTPNVEGSRNHQEAIARYTHEPPEIRDGSVGFGHNYEAVVNDDNEPELVDGEVQEFSTVNFPGGYDDGGVEAAFAEAVEEEIQFGGHGEDGGDVDMEELEKVYSEWESLVNMTEEQMEMWDEHPCSNEGVDDGEQTRTEFMMLMGKSSEGMEGWGRSDMMIANRVVAFINKQMRKDPENPEDGGPGTCPSRWAVSLLNRGHNPFDGFPSGNPTFGEQQAGEFDDPADEERKSGENLAAFTISTKQKEI